jgi:CheY-like chemotaxis protein/phage shock protein PspC (stress-responsive transcriptional regulator)
MAARHVCYLRHVPHILVAEDDDLTRELLAKVLRRDGHEVTEVADGAEALEKFLERRGQFVELDDGQTAMRPVQPSDVLVVLMSKDFALATTRLRLEQRALDAWAEQRLIVVKLDKGIAPVGLRDLPSIDASFEARREFTWQEVANAIRERARAPAAPGDAPPASPAPPRKKGLHGAVIALGLSLLAIPGLVVAAALLSLWLVNRIGPRPGGWTELRVGVDALGGRYGVQPLLVEIVFAAALLVTLVVIGLFIGRLFVRPKTEEASREGAVTKQPEAPGNAVFVSYARANAAAVMPVIEGAKRNGGVFWLDQKSIGAGEGWAGEIVRAIRGAADVVVMESTANSWTPTPRR